MYHYDNIITDILPRDLATCGLGEDDTRDDMLSVADDLRTYYGVTFEEYVDVRNALLEEHGGAMTCDELHNTLFNRIIIDLIGRGFLKIGNAASPMNATFMMTTKGTDAIIRALIAPKTDLPEEPYQALIYLRNHNLLSA